VGNKCIVWASRKVSLKFIYLLYYFDINDWTNLCVRACQSARNYQETNQCSLY